LFFSGSSDHDKLKRGWVGQIFHSNVGAEARGEAILIRKDTPFVSSKVISDTDGRYIIVKLFGTQVILANLYGPNWDDAQILSVLIVTLPDLNSHHLILGQRFQLCIASKSRQIQTEAQHGNFKNQAQ
jgi:hypothetical protein